MSINAPSPARLRALLVNCALPDHLETVDAAIAEIRRIWKLPKTCGISVPSEDYISVEHLRRNHVYPKVSDIKLAALNDILCGHGIESMETANTGEYADYINMGDMYVPTVVWWRGRLSLCEGGIGGFIESQPVKFR